MDMLLLSWGFGAAAEFLAPFAAATPDFTVGYIGEAAGPYSGQGFVGEEKERLVALGHPVVDVAVAGRTADEFRADLERVHAVYVAGGNTFSLAAALAEHGAGAVLAERVRAGMPYIGCSAGSIVAGTSLEAATLMDDPTPWAGRDGLGLVDLVYVPHADGTFGPYPLSLIADTVAKYGSQRLVLVGNDDALRVDEGGIRLVASRWR